MKSLGHTLEGEGIRTEWDFLYNTFSDWEKIVISCIREFGGGGGVVGGNYNGAKTSPSPNLKAHFPSHRSHPLLCLKPLLLGGDNFDFEFSLNE